MDYLKTVVKTKNPEKLAELIGYIEKHKSEIIDYQRFPLARNLMFLKVVILQQTHKDLLIFFLNQSVTEF